MNEEKIKRYLRHLDNEGLTYLTMYLLKETEEAKKNINMMAEEFDHAFSFSRSRSEEMEVQEDYFQNCNFLKHADDLKLKKTKITDIPIRRDKDVSE